MPFSFFRVSIHAPWEGCDCSWGLIDSIYKSFNSRTLGRVRLYERERDELLKRFNSRTLGRVRPTAPPAGREPRGVSIHAPWEGCDLPFDRVNDHEPEFQFTHPGKGATRSAIFVPIAWVLFQFTHPGKGATIAFFTSKACGSVSIHAPWEGCDRYCLVFG